MPGVSRANVSSADRRLSDPLCAISPTQTLEGLVAGRVCSRVWPVRAIRRRPAWFRAEPRSAPRQPRWTVRTGSTFAQLRSVSGHPLRTSHLPYWDFATGTENGPNFALGIPTMARRIPMNATSSDFSRQETSNRRSGNETVLRLAGSTPNASGSPSYALPRP